MKLVTRINHFLHDHLLATLLAVYVLAGFLPGFGVWMREQGYKGTFSFTLPSLMLAYLLFNAGFSIRVKELTTVLKTPLPLIVGLLANVLVPLVYTLFFAAIARTFWHNLDETNSILMGLAIVASMPIAGSSTAWVQNSGGNVALILGLVVFSTLLSPLLSPLVFHLIGTVTTGDYSEDLHELASQGITGFLVGSVVIPSLLGMAFRKLVGENRAPSFIPVLKMLALVDLVFLNYSNASTALPQAFLNPDYDFLFLILGVTIVLCFTGFSLGWFLPTLIKAKAPEKIALMYGLGMNNNGTGLVLVSTALADHTNVMLPIIFYNLGQQIVAGVFNLKTKSKLEAVN